MSVRSWRRERELSWYLAACLVTGGSFGTSSRAAGDAFDLDFEWVTQPDDDGFLLDDLDNELAELDLEALMQVDVTTVAGVEESWFTAPAAIYVITAEDIRRTGHRSIAEAMRMVPGMNVARINSSNWAISARGFNGAYANKLQVLVDGRVVYDPLFSGVFWDIQDVILEDLDRIEIIRGPGATLWGANAVNGVINVITRSAKDTQGLFVQGGYGTEHQGFGAIRYGGQAAENTWFRVWTKYENHDHTDLAFTGNRHDDWDFAHAGFRVDHEGDEGAVITVDASAYYGDIGEEITQPDPTGPPFTSRTLIGDGQASGGHVLFRFAKEVSEDTGWTFQTYYDRTERIAAAGFEVDRNTVDFDLRGHFEPADRHEIVWGAGYRHTWDQTQGTATLSFNPSSRSLDTFTAFVQDTITLEPDRLHLMVGSKFEHNDHTGFEFQPSGRLWWTPNEEHTVWGAVSRAVRTPSRTEDDLFLVQAFTPFPPPADVIAITGNPSSESEELFAYELGHRMKVTDDFILDTALFYNDYDKLTTTDSSFTFQNDGTGEAYGVELASQWRVADNWRLDSGYTFHRVQVHAGESASEEGVVPQHQFNIRSAYDLTEDIELNSALYFVDNVPTYDIDSYWRLDVGMTFQLTDNMELSVWGQNLLDDQHPEYSEPLFQANQSQIERAVYFQLTCRF
ncbi:MAG: TonB-dependent receptor plug domain-containing protein [Phycisphaerales bacterium]